MNISSRLIAELTAKANKQRAKTNAWFFKTGEGQYGAGDVFLGVTIPQLRAIVKPYEAPSSTQDAKELLASPVHEIRMAGTLLLVAQYARHKGSHDAKRALKAYLAAIGKGINNWDLVDTSAASIVGHDTFERKDVAALLALCGHKNMWKRRVGIVATFYWLKQGDPHATLICAKVLLDDTQDLMHKATGWMLREMGKKCGMDTLRVFLDSHADEMPRTMLRYAIEKMSAKEKARWMARGKSRLKR